MGQYPRNLPDTWTNLQLYPRNLPDTWTNLQLYPPDSPPGPVDNCLQGQWTTISANASRASGQLYSPILAKEKRCGVTAKTNDNKWHRPPMDLWGTPTGVARQTQIATNSTASGTAIMALRAAVKMHWYAELAPL